MVGAPFALPACGTGCDDDARPALVIQVKSSSGATVCDAVVVVTDGSFTFTQTLSKSGSGDICRYSGPFERLGPYTVTATLGSLQASLDVEVDDRDECSHVETRAATVTLPAS